MKKTAKLLSLILALLMLVSTVPAAFASGECVHNHYYKIEICPDGSSDKLFMTCQHMYMVVEVEYAGMAPGVYFDELRYCPDCDSIQRVIYRNGEDFMMDKWESVTKIEERGSLEQQYGIYRPGSCFHKNRVDLPLEPTCKSYYLDKAALISVITEQYEECKDNPEKLAEIMTMYDSTVQEHPNNPNHQKMSAGFSYCPDCDQMYYKLVEYNGDNSIIASDYGPIEIATKLDTDGLLASLRPALAHEFANGKCTVCGQKDPSFVEPTPEEPSKDEPSKDEPSEKSFFEKIADFFKKIIDWFKNLFSFLK